MVVVPPLSVSADRYDWAEALQFMVLALVAPGLVVAGAPWDLLGLGPVVEKLAAARNATMSVPHGGGGGAGPRLHGRLAYAGAVNALKPGAGW